MTTPHTRHPEHSRHRVVLQPLDDAATLGIAAVAYAALLLVATLDREHPSVGSAMIALAYAIPLSTLASFLGRLPRPHWNPLVTTSLRAVSGYIALAGMLATLTAIYHVFAFVSAQAAAVYKDLVIAAGGVLVLATLADLVVEARRTRKRRHSASAVPPN